MFIEKNSPMAHPNVKLNEIDIQIGARASALRTAAQISSQAAADACGMSELDYKQCENGERRLSASELYALTNIFNARVAEFFEDLDKL